MSDYTFLKRFAAALLLAISAQQGVRAQETLDGVAAVVQTAGAAKSDVITVSQVRELVGPREKALHDSGVQGKDLVEQIKKIRLDALNNLIDRQLVLQEFEKNKFTLPEFAIDEQVQQRIREDFNGDRKAFLRTLEAQGMTMEKFRLMEKNSIIVQSMRQRVVKNDVIIPPKQIEEYYAKNGEEFSTPEQIKLRMIVLKKEDNESGVRRNMLKEIRDKIMAGAEFGKLAQMYSDDSTKENEGDWGWIDKHTLNESLTRIAFKLKAGEVSEIVEMAGNYYLLYVEARKNAITKPLGEVRTDIEKKLAQEERQRLQQKWIDGLRKKAYVKTF